MRLAALPWHTRAMNPVLTAAFTVYGGAVVVAAGQWTRRSVVGPIREQRRVISEVAHALVFEADVGSKSDPARREEARSNLRGLSARLRATLWTIPHYAVFQSLGVVPTADDVMAASTRLVGWADNIAQDDPENRRGRLLIAQKLGIRGVD